MKVLATGAAGMLGSYLPAHAIGTDVDTLDVRKRDQVAAALEEHAPDVVLHLGAATDVDLCEMQPDQAWRTNALGTRNVAVECGARNIVLLYVSTAGVFWGDKQDPYHEFDIPRPANVYGHSKLAGEDYVKRFARCSFIVRAGWMIGGGPGTEKKFIAKMLERAGRIGRIVAVNDKWGSPTYGKHLMPAFLKLIETGDYGTYHMVNEGTCTRYDVACVVNDALGGPFEIEPVSSAHFPLPAPRARSEMMENMLLRLQGWDWMPSWQEAVGEYIADEWEGWTPAVAHARDDAADRA